MTEGSGLHVGVTPWSFDPEGASASLPDQAERAEQLGFRSFWLPESHFTGAGSIPAPLLLLSAVAARTQRLCVATTSFLLTVRHPLHVAAEVAVLDRLSRGRVILGVGRGFRKTLFNAFDVPASEKRDRFEAALQTMQRAWQGEPVAWENDADPVQPVRLSPLPEQKPHPPIWVAAFGPKALAQAGRLGLPYLASPIEPWARLESNYARHREALPEALRNGALPVPIMRTIFVHPDAATRERVREALERQARSLARAASPTLRGLAPSGIDDWALVGEAGAVGEGLARCRERLGMTHLIARAQVPGAEPAELMGSLEALAEIGRDLS